MTYTVNILISREDDESDDDPIDVADHSFDFEVDGDCDKQLARAAIKAVDAVLETIKDNISKPIIDVTFFN